MQAAREGGSENYLWCNLGDRGFLQYSGHCINAAQFMLVHFQLHCDDFVLGGLTTAQCNEQVLCSLEKLSVITVATQYTSCEMLCQGCSIKRALKLLTQ